VIQYLVRRLISSILVLWAATIGVFMLVATSGDPLAELKLNPLISEATIRNRAHLLHLDKSLIERYWIWFSGIFRGDLGRTYRNADVRSELFGHMVVTMRMVILALFLAVFIAISLGVLAAVRRGRAVDRAIQFSSFFFLATPVFVVGLFFQYYVAVPLAKHFHRQIFSTAGATGTFATGNFIQRLPDYFAHMTLPTVTLILAVFSSWTIYQRSSILETVNLDYVLLARSKGISPRRVLVRHVLRNALIPVTTVIALDFAGLLGGALITEQVYSWNGLGRWYLMGASNQDVNVTLAYLLFTATVVITFNFLADVAYGILDPRIRYQ